MCVVFCGPLITEVHSFIGCLAAVGTISGPFKGGRVTVSNRWEVAIS